jgi:hypothetical protein
MIGGMEQTDSESRHVSERIDRRASEVYDFVVDPANLPRWAPGLGGSVENVDAGLVRADLARLKRLLEAA